MRTLIKVLMLSLCLIPSAFANSAFLLSILSLDEATKKIIKESKSKILDATTEVVNGNNVHIIKVLTADGRVQYIKVDVDSGKIIR
ncbi:MAG: hypothetical protein ABGX40_05375 [Methylococcales bacterium]|jgi:uncharacterized membrane protein YkoI